jgi:ketoreductase
MPRARLLPGGRSRVHAIRTKARQPEKKVVTERAAIITGASSGIGFALAEMLGRRGYSVTLNSRRVDRLELAAQRLRSEGFDVEAVAGSVSDEAVVARVVDAHRSRFGRLDVLVNNAGMGIREPFEAISNKSIDLQLDTNLRQFVIFYRHAIDLLLDAGREHGNALVVNSASVTAIRPDPSLAVYCAAKAGVIAFVEAMNLEYRRRGVKSCALCPGFVNTEMSSFAGPQDRHLMIQAGDIAKIVETMLDLSPGCVVSEVILESVLAIGPGLTPS